MGRIAAVLSFERVDELGEKSVNVKIDLGGNNVLTPPQFTPAGVDAPPLEGDYAVTVPTPGDSGKSVVGYSDPNNEGVAEGGEFRAYARDEDGAVVVAVILKKDGTVELGAATDNMVRYSEYEAAFNDLQTKVQIELAKILATLGSFAIPPVIPYSMGTLDADPIKAKIEEFKVPEWEAPEE